MCYLFSATVTVNTLVVKVNACKRLADVKNAYVRNKNAYLHNNVSHILILKLVIVRVCSIIPSVIS